MASHIILLQELQRESVERPLAQYSLNMLRKRHWSIGAVYYL